MGSDEALVQSQTVERLMSPVDGTGPSGSPQPWRGAQPPNPLPTTLGPFPKGASGFLMFLPPLSLAVCSCLSSGQAT